MSAEPAQRYPAGDAKPIVITFVRDSLVFPAVVSTRSTLQMNFLNSTHIISQFPSLTIQRRGLLAWSAATQGVTEYALIRGVRRSAPLGDHIELASGNADTGRACNSSCPRQWRFSEGQLGAGVFQWSSLAQEVPFERVKFMWRLNNKCDNPLCDSEGHCRREMWRPV
jgi:hypothetical protein